MALLKLQFDDFLKDLPKHTLFGFDSEFFTGSNKKLQVSIMQIATRWELTLEPNDCQINVL